MSSPDVLTPDNNNYHNKIYKILLLLINHRRARFCSLHFFVIRDKWESMRVGKKRKTEDIQRETDSRQQTAEKN